jgi:Big-like domain-containing protein
MSAVTIRVGAAAGLAVALAATWSASPAKAAPAAGQRLFITSFSQDGRADVERNETLVFAFSTRLRRRSVDDRTLRIVDAEGVPARGARIVQGNKVFFDPTRTQRNFDQSRLPNTTVTEKDNLRGLAANHDFVVTIPAAPGRHVLRGVGGRIVRRFTGGFRTNERYSDPVPGQPSFVGDHGSGLFGFDPPRGDGGLLDENAAVVLEFSEPILPTTLVPGTTVIVERGGIPVDGTIREDPVTNGRRFLFEPNGGWGFDVRPDGDITVKLTTGITDLAGNALKQPVGS